MPPLSMQPVGWPLARWSATTASSAARNASVHSASLRGMPGRALVPRRQ